MISVLFTTFFHYRKKYIILKFEPVLFILHNSKGSVTNVLFRLHFYPETGDHVTQRIGFYAKKNDGVKLY